MDDEQIGTNLRALREAANLSQAELAFLAVSAGWQGVYPQTILKIEKGQRSLKVTEAVYLSPALGFASTPEFFEALEMGAANSESAEVVTAIRAQHGHAMNAYKTAMDQVEFMLDGRARLALLVPRAIKLGRADNRSVQGAKEFVDMPNDELRDQLWGEVLSRVRHPSRRPKGYERG